MDRRIPTRLMSPAALSAITVLGTAVALAVAAPAGAAQPRATGSPPWRVVKVFATTPVPHLRAVTASGPGNAWAAGVSASAVVVKRWNGRGWRGVPVPARFNVAPGFFAGDDEVIGSSSPRNVWTFPQVNTASGTANFALRWNGSSWRTFRLRGTLGIFHTAVFGRDDAWAFGQAPARKQGLGFGPPYVIRFNGSSWRRVSMPGTPLDVSPLSARDIWAFGPTTKTAINTGTAQDRVAMHWNGKAWRTLAVPRYRLSGHRALVQAVIALGRDDLWAVEGVAGPACGCEPPSGGLILAHWNGRRWREVRRDPADILEGSISSDGHGGVDASAAPSVGCRRVAALRQQPPAAGARAVEERPDAARDCAGADPADHIGLGGR
jgi:hypothetical protein